MAKKLIVGLTGLYSSGKSTVAEIFEKHQYEVIEVDKLGHQALIDNQKMIIESFGEKIKDENNLIDRKKLGAIVFQDKNEMKKLENIVHPYMVQRVKDLVGKSQSDKIVISAAILIEMELHTICDKVVMVIASEEKLIEWGNRRDGISPKQVKQRLKNQLPLKKRKAYADELIDNEGNLQSLCDQVNQLISRLESEGNR